MSRELTLSLLSTFSPLFVPLFFVMYRSVYPTLIPYRPNQWKKQKRSKKWVGELGLHQPNWEGDGYHVLPLKYKKHHCIILNCYVALQIQIIMKWLVTWPVRYMCNPRFSLNIAQTLITRAITVLNNNIAPNPPVWPVVYMKRMWIQENRIGFYTLRGKVGMEEGRVCYRRFLGVRHVLLVCPIRKLHYSSLYLTIHDAHTHHFS